MAWAIGVAALVLSLVAAAQIGSILPLGFDFDAYWSAARRLASGEPLYPSATTPLGSPGEFRYFPAVAALFLPLAALPFAVASVVWFALLVVVAACVGAYLVRPLPGHWRPWAAATYALFLPLVLEIGLGNLNLVTLALCLLAWHWRGRAPVSGAFLAAAVGLKLLPIVLPIFYLAAGRIRVVLWAAAWGLAALATSAVLMPGPVADFIAFAPRVGDPNWFQRGTDRTEPAFLAAVLLAPWLPYALLAAAIAIAAAAGLAARRGRDGEIAHRLTLAVVPYAISVGVFWTTLVVMSLPLLAIALDRAVAVRGALARAILLGGLALCWLLMNVVGLGDLIPVAAHLLGVVVLCTIAVTLMTRATSPANAMSGSGPRPLGTSSASHDATTIAARATDRARAAASDPASTAGSANTR
jgi:hypothetical protein